MTNFIQITPVMHVRDLDATVAFFTDILGFKAHIHARDYAYVHRETAGVRILLSDIAKTRADSTPSNRPFECYIDVRDLDALLAELKTKLDTLPPDDVIGPANQSWGQRELIVIAPDGSAIVFGQEIASNHCPDPRT